MIAIIMATYNGEEYLREQLDSLFQNTCQDWKLYLFDDGSTDGTIEIAKTYQKAYPGRIMIRSNPKNLKSARNFFAGFRQVWKEAPAEYYMFCDQDDCWDPDKIECSLKKLRQMEKREGKNTPLLVYTDSRLTDEDGRVTAPSFQKASRYRRILEQTSRGKKRLQRLAHLLIENTMPGCTQMLNQALANQVFENEGFPDRLKMHDWWLGLVAAAFGEIGYLDQATMSYRQHRGNVVGGSGFASYLKARLCAIGTLRHTIREDIRQGKSFYQWYGKKLEAEERELLEAFCALETAGFFRRRALLCHYHFWKSGLVRNAALFWLI